MERVGSVFSITPPRIIGEDIFRIILITNPAGDDFNMHAIDCPDSFP
jgi:hypothetical protein